MEILLQNIVILYHLVGKSQYNINNKLDQLNQKIFNTIFVSTIHIGYNFLLDSFGG